jgi:hypothetical protein
MAKKADESIKGNILPAAAKDRLVEIVNNTHSWKAVEDWVRNGNPLNLPKYMLDSKGDFPFFAYHAVASTHAQQNPPKSLENHSEELTGTVVDVGGITVTLHGLFHTDEYSQAARAHLKGKDLVVLEPNLSRIYPEPNHVAQTRVDELRYVPNLWTFMWQSEFSAGVNSARDSATGAMKGILQRLGSKTKRYKSEQELGQSRQLMIAGLDISRYNLPKDLEADYIRKTVESGGRHADAILRSLSQAEFLVRTAQEKKVREAHWLGGMAHEPQIAYFLRNPEFADGLRHQYAQEKERTYNSVGALSFKVLGLISAGIGVWMGTNAPHFVQEGRWELAAGGLAYSAFLVGLGAVGGFKQTLKIPPTPKTKTIMVERKH